MLKLIKYIIAWFRIPRGFYCYKIKEIVRDPTGQIPPVIRTKICPYWDIRGDWPHQANGYCHYLGYGDMNINEEPEVEFICTEKKTGAQTTVKAPDMPFGVGLLWDQCKECGIKTRDIDDEEYEYEEDSDRN
jgi:hypothetical protein